MITLVEVADEIATAVRILARHRYAAVILWDPSILITGGIVLDAAASRPLLVSIFIPESLNGLRDGVAVLRGGRVERAGVPFTWTDVVARAAKLAVGPAVGVDENTGEVRLVDRAGRVANIDAVALANRLHAHACRSRGDR